MADDIDPLSAALHSFGKNAIDVAVGTVSAHFEARDVVLAGRARTRKLP